jgi:HPt (histidine-containing phosphotransfer) domain-containing protein
LVLSRFGGNKNLLQKAAKMFPSESDAVLSAIDQAKSEGNLPNLESAAHTLKGLCRMFEANDAAGIAFEMETGARAGNLATEEQVQRLKSEIRRAAESIAQLVDQLAQSTERGLAKSTST